ncbi:hypothetical protein SynBIOSU31_01413 [Synechococcus sp. BIOS-U3-1]|nr:hypothetical protein SynBIOSU31_01413 [Synechococcus sp. BIOS-U3-1]
MQPRISYSALLAFFVNYLTAKKGTLVTNSTLIDDYRHL